MNRSLEEAFEKRFGLENKEVEMGNHDSNIEERAKIVHAFVLKTFQQSEFQITQLNRAFPAAYGTDLTGFLGAKFKNCRTEPWFARLFVSKPGGVYSAKGEAMVDIDSDSAKQVLAQAGASSGSDNGAVRKVLGMLKLENGTHFCGVFESNARKLDAKLAGPGIRSVYVEGIKEKYASSALLGERFKDAGYKAGVFTVGVCDQNGIPTPLDRSTRSVVIRRWTSFFESEKGSLEEFLSADANRFIKPKFGRTQFRETEMIILDNGCLYRGFDADKQEKKVGALRANGVRVARGNFDRLENLSSIIKAYGEEGWFDFDLENIFVGEPNRDRWQTTDAFFADSMWEVFKAKPKSAPMAVTGGTIADVASSVDGQWGKNAVLEVYNLDPAEKTANHDSFYCNCSDDERQFLKRLIKAISDSGYIYDPRDIIRFHTSVKTGMITLLGGAPGCGKSSLAKLYAMALQGGSNDADFLTVDVSPAWTEPQDLLGYWNLEGQYMFASSGLVPFLQAANRKDAMQLVCLEEMNLARVEHYFADFIQTFSREESDRVIHGVPAAGQIRGEDLMLTPNVRFIGTNNYDETTQQISARFYDRCNYIELTNVGKKEPFAGSAPFVKKELFDFGVSYQKYNNWYKREWQKIAEGVVEKMIELVPLLEALRLSVSKRAENAIAQYITNRPFIGYESGKTTADFQLVALDEAIAQRVLPRYRPNFEVEEHSKINKLLKALEPLDLSHAFFSAVTNSKELPQRA